MPGTENYGFPTPVLQGVKPDIAADLLALGTAIDAKIKQLQDARIAAEAALADDGEWVNIEGSFNASWENYPAPYQEAGYKIDGGMVWLRGLVRTTILRNAVSTMFTLPVPARPVEAHIMPTYATNIYTANATAVTPSGGSSHTHSVVLNTARHHLTVEPTGAVTVRSTSAWTFPANQLISLSGAYFPLS